ncbi:TonB-dependent copper receptor [Sideroxydans lithotrophicus]|uniref:TonB-dependent copper receptor n=1 Tax=Sideroxydans lithotrophicus (strain ES-1) TaxID=580332 RepID=D5CNQ7_SIDLE|nr:TonB-dependent copper receptor [Sideroxydans lithotrophicus]ADE10970.1 TonB-dependent copper receptor [Sideroxydans lithotrophicus ES-1]
MNLKLKMSVAAVALAMGSAAQAAETAALDEVVVTAPQSAEPLTVKTNPKKPRQPVPAHDGADYLKTIPGFSVIRKGGTDGDPVFRGMAGSRLNILLDGEQILGGCGGRMDPPTAYVFPASYDRITLLKGPQTVLYGPGSSAGTVLFERIVDRAVQAETHAHASLMLGSFGRNDEMLDAQTGSSSYYLRAGATRSHSNDYQDGSGNIVHSQYTRWSTNAALGWTPDDNTRLELTAAKSDGKAAYADRAVDGSKFARDNVGLKLDKRHMGGVLDGVEAQVYYNYIDHVMDSYSMRAGNPASTMAAMNPDRKTTGGRLAGTLQLADATQLKLGLDAQNNVHTNRSGAAPGYIGDYTLQPRVKDAEFKNVGVFGELHQDMSESSRVVAGLRADSWQATDYRTTVVRGMTMVANPTANQTRKETLSSGFARYEHDVSVASTMYVGLGRTTRAPDYWELFNKESLTTASAFNTNPEKTTQLDAGLNYREGGLSGSLSAFYSKITDFNLIQSGVNKGTVMMPVYVTVTRNVNATTYGAEAGMAWQLADNWKIDGSLAYVHGNNDTDGTALGQIPPLEGRLGLNYDDGTWSFGGLLRAVAAQNRVAVNQGNIAGQDIAATGGFGVFSLNGGWRASKAVQVTAGLDNVFNKTYAEHISRAGTMVAGYIQTTRINELGRNMWVKANFDF